MLSRWKFGTLALIAGLLAWSPTSYAQYDDTYLDEELPPSGQQQPAPQQPAPVQQDTAPAAPPQLPVEPTNITVHPHITVNGVQVYYFYDAANQPRYYYFDASGNRIFYDVSWRPWYYANGMRVFFAPTPYVIVDNRPYFYYWYNGAQRYYWYNGVNRVFLHAGWRPWYYRGGARIFYAPRVRYNYSTWYRNYSHIRYHYRPNVYRRLYTNYYRRYYRPNYYRNYNRYRSNPAYRYNVRTRQFYRRTPTYRHNYRRTPTYRHNYRRTVPRTYRGGSRSTGRSSTRYRRRR